MEKFGHFEAAAVVKLTNIQTEHDAYRNLKHSFSSKAEKDIYSTKVGGDVCAPLD